MQCYVSYESEEEETSKDH